VAANSASSASGVNSIERRVALRIGQHVAVADDAGEVPLQTHDAQGSTEREPLLRLLRRRP
jgi:hypothetical protein